MLKYPRYSKLLFAIYTCTICIFAPLQSYGIDVPLIAKCYKLDNTTDADKTYGVKINRRTEIGSVSKIITAYWALNVLGPDYKFKTQVYISPNYDKNKKDKIISYDVHLKGGHDPYFGVERLQALLAYLVKNGIRKIRNLSFDENFKYFENPESENIAHEILSAGFPDQNEIQTYLQSSIINLNEGYPDLVARYKKYNIALPKSISINIKKIKFSTENPEDTKNKISFDLNEARSIIFYSSPLINILKEINRNSNNFASNIIFQSIPKLAGELNKPEETFSEFILQNLNLTENEINMVNGTGGPLIEDSRRAAKYNQATCESVLKILHSLKTFLYDNGRHSLSDMMSVVGIDTQSTTGLYSNAKTNGAVVAKTGTIDKAVSLAGLASTKNGDVLFALIYGPTNTKLKIDAARKQIAVRLRKLISENGGSERMDYIHQTFDSLDLSIDVKESDTATD